MVIFGIDMPHVGVPDVMTLATILLRTIQVVATFCTSLLLFILTSQTVLCYIAPMSELLGQHFCCFIGQQVLYGRGGMLCVCV